MPLDFRLKKRILLGMSARDKDAKKYNDENSSLFGKIGRYSRVSSGMAGLAAKLAGQKFLGLDIARDEHAVQLTNAIGNLKGPLMKVGQILATIPNALPPEYAEEFKKLQNDAPSMGWPFVRRRMRGELGADWQSNFKEFGQEAAAAASLGQVHRAVTQNGVDVACKLQYPGMLSAVEADLKQLKLMFKIFETYDKAISTTYIHQELSERLLEELDYKLEAQNAKLYAKIFKNDDRVFVPEVIESLSTERLLTATWLEGSHIMDFKDDDIETRNTIALNMFNAWYTPFYHYGIIHGDPHLGNYSVRKDLSLNLLDFGCIRIFPPSFVEGVIDLYKALLTKDDALAYHAYQTWGFGELNKEQLETLNVWAGFLYAPLLDDKVRPIGEVTEGIYGRDTAEKVHKKLREVGGITVPREFVFMDRAALGLGSVFLHLRSEINWYRLFNEMIEGFDVKTLEAKQKTLLQEVGHTHKQGL